MNLRIPFQSVDDDNPIPFEQEDPKLGDLMTFFLSVVRSLKQKNGRKAHHPFFFIGYWSNETGAGRNDSCPCQSGKKFKKCCINT